MFSAFQGAPRPRRTLRPRRLLHTAVAAGTLAILLPAASASAATYSVTITNLTKGQPLSPPVIATHRGHGDLFGYGRTARYGVQQVAENGGVPVLVAELQAERDRGLFDDVQQWMSGPLVPSGLPASAMLGKTAKLTITSKNPGARLSWVSMLACTNDGFAGVDGFRLPHRVGSTHTTWAWSYDAGSERNTESFVDLVGGCQAAVGVKSSTGATGTNMSNPLLREDGRIRYHAGVRGIAADGLLRSVHGWYGPAARLSVTRTA